MPTRGPAERARRTAYEPVEPVGPIELARDAVRQQTDHAGRFRKGNKLATREHRRLARDRRLAQRYAAIHMPLDEVAPVMRPYIEAARAWLEAQLHELAAGLGEGMCGAMPGSALAAAAQQRAASEYLFAEFARTGDAKDLQLANNLALSAQRSQDFAARMAKEQAAARKKNKSEQPADLVTLLTQGI